MSILADTFYAEYLKEDCTLLENEIHQRYAKWVWVAAQRLPLVRGALAYWIGRRYDLIVTVQHHPGGTATLFFERWFGTGVPKVVLAEFLTSRSAGHILRRLIYPLWFAFILRPSVRGAMRAGQVMTRGEVAYYARKFGIAPERFSCIHFPLSLGAPMLPRQHAGKHGFVFASGHASCDWRTLFQAAEGADWPLVVVCSKHDLARVKKLNKRGRAMVLSDIPGDQHNAYMRQATVYALCLAERVVSTGQVRLRTAIACGTPVVATAVRGLEGYVVEGITALTVPPGDAIELRRRIEHLLNRPEERQRLTNEARRFVEDRDLNHYSTELRHFVRHCLSNEACAS